MPGLGLRIWVPYVLESRLGYKRSLCTLLSQDWTPGLAASRVGPGDADDCRSNVPRYDLRPNRKCSSQYIYRILECI